MEVWSLKKPMYYGGQKQNKTKQQNIRKHKKNYYLSCLLLESCSIDEIFSASLSENNKAKRHSSVELSKKQTNKKSLPIIKEGNRSFCPININLPQILPTQAIINREIGRGERDERTIKREDRLRILAHT